jgi:hypothetical protein
MPPLQQLLLRETDIDQPAIVSMPSVPFFKKMSIFPFRLVTNAGFLCEGGSFKSGHIMAQRRSNHPGVIYKFPFVPVVVNQADSPPKAAPCVKF